MPTTPTATPFNTADWSLSETREGFTGVRFYQVDTDSQDWVNAVGLPSIGAPWDFSDNTLRLVCVQSRSARILSPADTPRSPGRTLVEVRYQTVAGQGGGGGGGKPKPGDVPAPQDQSTRYTVVSWDSTTIPVLTGWAAPSDPKPGLNDAPDTRLRDPESRPTGTLRIEVYTYLPASTAPDLDRYSRLAGNACCNSDAVNLPARLADNRIMACAVGQLRYIGFRGPNKPSGGPAVDGSTLYEVVHQLEYSPVGWDVAEGVTDEQGNLTSVRLISVSPFAPFTGLW
jgi:hypothetical protein